MPDKKKKKGEKKIENTPDHRIRRVEDGSEEAPRIFKMVKRSRVRPKSRRTFIQRLAGAAGVAAAGKMLTGCGSSYSVDTKDDTCTCHVVCSCDTEGPNASKNANTYSSTWEGTVCTCDTVCTCNSVCTCNTVCTCDSQGGGGTTSYWYPN
jgi:hypothetical protein